MYVCPPLIESYIDLVFFLLHSLLMASGDQQQVNNAKKELQKPCAVCCRCEQVLLLDEFSHEQWEQIRANIPAFCAACKNGKETTRKRKLNADSLEIYMCTGCSQNQFAAAFPRAQLLQAQAETQRQCLKCLQAQRTEMRCCRCLIKQNTPRIPIPNGHHARGRYRVLAMPRRVAPINAQAGGGWLLCLQDLCQDLPQCNRYVPGPEPPLHELSGPGPQKGRGANLPQSCLQKKVD